MVRYAAQQIFVEEEDEEEQDQEDSNSKTPKHPLDPLDPGLPDFSFVDSLLDFDFMEDFLEDTSELGIEKKTMEVSDNETSVEAAAATELMVKEEPLDLDSGIEKPSSVADACELMVNEDSLEVEKEGNLGAFIEEKLGRFSLVGNDSEAHSVEEFVAANELLDDQILTTGATVVAALASIVADKMSGSSSSSGSSGNEDDDGGGGNDSESGKESGSSSFSSSGSSDDEEEEEEEEDVSDEQEDEKEDEKKEGEVTMKLDEEVEGGEFEEGEIRDDNGDGMVGNSDDEDGEEDGEKMVEWSDSEFVDVDEEEDGFGGVKGPIKSKNELEVLPPVPPVEATLETHHQMLPVGIVLSTLGAQVIVEGTDKHNPLNEGSILWITEKRSPLGIVDEIFGPVQNPYYVVRYNSETEVPAEICQGTLVSFVAEFAQHVLGEKNLYKKGYDASGEHDEELTDDGEFSDDEKEAEHRRMQKMSKRGLNQQTGNDSRRKNKNQNRNRNGNGNQNNSMPSAVGQQPPNHNQQNQHNNASPAGGATSSMNNGASFFPPFRPMVPTNGNLQPPNAGWLNPMPSQQPNAAFVPGGFPGNNMPWPAQNQPFQQLFNLNQGPVPNGVFPGGQLNLFANGPSPWQAMAAQNCFNQALLGMGFQMQQPNLPMMNLGGQQGMMCNPNQPQVQQNSNFPPPQMVASGDARPPQQFNSSDIRPPQQFNSGASSGHGSRPYQRGGSRGRGSGRGRGRFSGGRGH